VNSWLDPIIDPHELSVAAQRGERDPQAGLALLLDGQLFVYERLAIESNWPRLGTRPPKNAPRESKLLAAVGLQLTGSRGVSGVYDSISKGNAQDASFDVAVAILNSLHLASRNRDDDALSVLTQASEFARTSLESVLVQLHLGVRHAERGSFAEAIEVTESVKKIRPMASERPAYRALRAVAEHNAFHYRHLLGQFTDPFKLALRGSELPLLRAELDISTALAKYLEDQFEQVTYDPASRSITWRPEDPVEVSLRGSVVRAECLADWAEQRRTRALLGRYYVVSQLGTSEGVSPAAFGLLRRAGDYKGMQAAVRSVAALGPLVALGSELSSVLRRPWPRGEDASILALITGGADLLETREADRTLARLRSERELIARNAPEGLRAVARVVRAASDSAQTSASRFARSLAEELPEPLILQASGQILDAIRWPAVSPAERRRWVAYAEQHLLAERDERFLAERAIAALASSERESVSRVLLSAYEANPNVDRLALLVDAGVALPRKLRTQAIEAVEASLMAIQEEARSGSYAFGGTDVALLLLVLIRRSPQDPRWDALTRFLLDERVGVAAKTRTLEQLAAPSVSIPKRVQTLLRKNVQNITGFIDALSASQTSLHAATLRLWLKLGGVERDDLLTRLLELSGDLDVEGRREAARTLHAAQHRLGDDVAFTLGLTLTRDRDFSVRAAAGRSLGRLRQDRAGELGILATRRIESLLSETGTEVPFQTLAGLIEGQRDGLELRADIIAEARRVHRSHASRRVRELADVLIRESQADAKSRERSSI
jgi:hypothetical protein